MVDVRNCRRIESRISRLRLLTGSVLLACVCGFSVPAWAAQSAPPPSWQQEYWAQFDEKNWDAAITSAEQLVAASRPATAETGKRLSEALALLGSAQLGKGNLVAAEAAFAESLKLAEQYAGRSSAALVDPLRGLGYTLAAEGKHDQAIPYMDRALLISRRSAGLFDTSQQGLLRQLATSLTAVGAAPEAERHMQYLRRIGEHAYGNDDPQMVSILCTVGDWYAEVGQMDAARQHYRAATSIVERKLGKTNLGVVDPLRSLAASYPREVILSHFGIFSRTEKLSSLDPTAHFEGEPLNPRYLSSEGERALTRALKVVEETPAASPATLVGTLVQMGDWFVMKMQPDKAMPFYERAASVLAKPENQAATADMAAALGFPSQVYYPTPPIATRNLNRPPYETEDHFVQIEFTVQADSTVSDVRVVDKEANERQVGQVVEAMRAARYRPKLVDGKPTATTAVSYRQVFKVRKEAESAE